MSGWFITIGALVIISVFFGALVVGIIRQNKAYSIGRTKKEFRPFKSRKGTY
jgi:hypothetical protein